MRHPDWRKNPEWFFGHPISNPEWVEWLSELLIRQHGSMFTPRYHDFFEAITAELRIVMDFEGLYLYCYHLLE